MAALDVTISTRIPKQDALDLQRKHPQKGKRGLVLRALIQMYLKGKITQPLVYENKQTV